MKYKLDDDRRGFHIWFDEPEFQKLLRDSTVDVSLDAYLEEMILYNVLEDVAKAVRSGLQSDIPKITFTKVT